MNLAQNNSGGGVPKSPNPLVGPPTPDPLGSNPFIYQSIAVNLRIPNIQFLMGLTRDVQKLCSLGPPAPLKLKPPLMHWGSRRIIGPAGLICLFIYFLYGVYIMAFQARLVLPICVGNLTEV